MTAPRRLPVLVLLVLAACAIAYAIARLGSSGDATLARGHSPASGGRDTAPASSASAAGAGSVAVTPPPPARDVAPAPATPVRTARGAMTASREAFEHARNLGTLFNTLILANDPDALFFAERALRECMPYLMAGGQSTEPPPLDRYRPAPAGDPLTSRRQEAYAALQARCSGFDLGSDPPATRKALRDTLLAANDPRATLEQMAVGLRRGTAPDAAMDKTRELAATGDPYVLEQASALFASMRSKYVFMLDGQLVRPDIVAAGWMMAACDAGRSCGAEWVQAPCAFITECDARDLESSMQRYQLTPQDYDRMQQVRMRINRGVASGQWDAALFTPQAPPPGYRRWGP